MTSEVHNTEPRGRVLYGKANCPHCQKKTRHVLVACGHGRRICSVCNECGRHRRVLHTTADDARHNETATTRAVT